MIELTLDPEWIDREGVEGLAALASGWEGREVTRVAYPRRILERLERGFSDWTTPLILAGDFHGGGRGADFQCGAPGVFGRRQLIRSMDLVGAPPSRIRQPFIAEAMGYGLVGAMLAWRRGGGLARPAQTFLSVLNGWGPEKLALLLALQVGMGLLMTGLSARRAVARYPGPGLTNWSEPRAPRNAYFRA